MRRPLALPPLAFPPLALVVAASLPFALAACGEQVVKSTATAPAARPAATADAGAGPAVKARPE